MNLTLTVWWLANYCSWWLNNMRELYWSDIHPDFEKIVYIVSGIVDEIISDQEWYSNYPDSTIIQTKSKKEISEKLKEAENEDMLYENFSRLLTPEENKILEWINKAWEKWLKVWRSLWTKKVQEYVTRNQRKINKLPENSKILELIKLLYDWNNMTIAVEFLLKKHQIELKNLRNPKIQEFIDNFRIFVLKHIWVSDTQTTSQYLN